jgi:hypothetical protein
MDGHVESTPSSLLFLLTKTEVTTIAVTTTTATPTARRPRGFFIASFYILFEEQYWYH